MCVSYAWINEWSIRFSVLIFLSFFQSEKVLLDLSKFDNTVFSGKYGKCMHISIRMFLLCTNYSIAFLIQGVYSTSNVAQFFAHMLWIEYELQFCTSGPDSTLHWYSKGGIFWFGPNMMTNFLHTDVYTLHIKFFHAPLMCFLKMLVCPSHLKISPLPKCINLVQCI